MRPLIVFLSLCSCAPALRVVRPDEPPLRGELSARDPGKFHRVLGVDLWVHDSDPTATKPPIICLHAIGHGGKDFARVEDELTATWRIIAVDWPGHGRSSADTEPASAQRYAAILEALMTELQLTRVTLLGNSIGGAAAMRFAAAHPEQVRALVLANPGGLDPGGFLAPLFIAPLVAHFEEGERNEVRFAAWFRDFYADILRTDAAAAQRERIVAAGFEHATVLAQAWRSFAKPEANLESLIPKLTMPVLFTWAKRDALVSWGRNRAAVERFPNAKVEFFEDAGHSAFLESPEAFRQSLSRFLSTLAP